MQGVGGGTVITVPPICSELRGFCGWKCELLPEDFLSGGTPESRLVSFIFLT